jgi:ATP-dependent DNA helicase PIF1
LTHRRYPRREDVERSNTNRMCNIRSAARLYTATEGGALAGTDQGAKMLANFMAPAKLELKVGAQVCMLYVSPT